MMTATEAKGFEILDARERTTDVWGGALLAVSVAVVGQVVAESMSLLKQRVDCGGDVDSGIVPLLFGG